MPVGVMRSSRLRAVEDFGQTARRRSSAGLREDLVYPCTGRVVVVVVVVGTLGWGRGHTEGWGRDVAAAPGFLAFSVPGMLLQLALSGSLLTHPNPKAAEAPPQAWPSEPQEVFRTGPHHLTSRLEHLQGLSLWLFICCLFLKIAHVQAIFTASQFNTHLPFEGDPTLMAVQ